MGAGSWHRVSMTHGRLDQATASFWECPDESESENISWSPKGPASLLLMLLKVMYAIVNYMLKGYDNKSLKSRIVFSPLSKPSETLTSSIGQLITLTPNKWILTLLLCRYPKVDKQPT